MQTASRTRLRKYLNEKNYQRPANLSSDLSIGSRVSGWKPGSLFKGTFSQKLCTLKDILYDGEIYVELHTHGILLTRHGRSYSIHNSQVIDIDTISSTEIEKQRKSVIGEAAVGAFIGGPVGAVLGGLSGLFGTDDVWVDKEYVIITFWDVVTDAPQCIMVSREEGYTVDEFIELQKELTEHPVMEMEIKKEKTPVFPIIIAFCLYVAVVVFAFVFVA